MAEAGGLEVQTSRTTHQDHVSNKDIIESTHIQRKAEMETGGIGREPQVIQVPDPQRGRKEPSSEDSEEGSVQHLKF